MFEWLKLIVTVVFILLMIFVFIRNKNVLEWLIGLLFAHSIVIFVLRFFVGNEPLVDAVLSVVYFLVIVLFLFFVFKALKKDAS